HTALKNALHDDEYEELKESKLGVFIKFQELEFDWASRLVHYMLGFQLDIKKKYELWSLFENLTGLNCEYIEDLERPHCVVTKELTSFWRMLGVHVEAGPSTQEIIAAFERCEGWSRDDRKRLAYLAIFTGYIEGRKYLTPTRVSLARLVMELERFENYPWGRVAFKMLMDSVKGRDISGCYTINGFAQAPQVWAYTVLPELGANYGNPLPNNPSPPILAYKGGKGRKCFKEAILRQFDAEDTPAENIIKLMFVKRLWKWTMECWEVTGTWVNTKSAVVTPAKKEAVKENSPRPRKKARKEAPVEASESAPAEASEEVHTVARSEVTTTVGHNYAMREGFGTCLKEIKYLSERVEAVEKKVGITTKRKGTSSQNTFLYVRTYLQKEDARYLEKRNSALALYHAKSDRTRKLAASQQSLYTANSTVKVIIPNKNLYPGYDSFAPIDKKKLKELADWLKTCLHCRTPLDKKPRTSRTWWYQILRTSLEWLEDCQWRFNYKDFKDSKPDQNGLGRRLPGGAWNYYAGTIPSFCQSNKVWETDIDDVYAPVNYTDSHWIAMWISIPKRHIVVWDNICSSISPEELDVVMEHFLYMVPYLLVDCASSDEQRAQYSLEPFTYERLTNIPQARAGDCGVYALKYIE
uniref:Ubiquitin-like protease family profile domain-containing protein n=1 Tax=Brassica oleracea var. oleracea TaxID=109376 RepID=A0A0D3BWY0_BRAOL